MSTHSPHSLPGDAGFAKPSHSIPAKSSEGLSRKTAAACLFLAITAGALSTALAVRPAAQSTASATPAPVEDSTPAPPYVLKNRSSFTKPNEISRVPFWPIGWNKGKQEVATAAAQAETKLTIDEKSFKFTGIMLGAGTSQNLALINGRGYAEGDYFHAAKGTPLYGLRIRVGQIKDGTVTLFYDNQIITVKQSHPELNTHRSEDELLDQNR